MADVKQTVVPIEENPFIATNISTTKETTTKKSSTNAPAGLSTGPLQFMTKSGTSLPIIIISAIIGYIVPILQLYFGWRYAEECPINRKIPKYLLVAGAVGIVSVALNQLRGHMAARSMKSATKAGDPPSTTGAVSAPTGTVNTLLSIITSGLGIFMFCWFIAGCIWIFGVWNQVQYAPTNHPDYCNQTLYKFAYILIFLPIVFLLVCCCCPLCLGLVTACVLAKQST